MEEIWKSIKDYPDYEVSNLGRLAGIHKLKSTNNYQVRIYFNKKSVYLGTFKTIEKAKEVYNKFLNINQIKNKYL